MNEFRNLENPIHSQPESGWLDASIGLLSSRLGAVAGRLAARKFRTVRDLHRTRVILRRARAAVDFCEPCLKSNACQRLRNHLQKFSRLLGPPRDLDVLLENSLRWPSQAHPERFVQFLQTLSAERYAALRRADKTLQRRFQKNKLLCSRKHVRKHPLAPDEMRIRLDWELAALPAQPDLGCEIESPIHELRKRCRALRYQLEFLAELFPTSPEGAETAAAIRFFKMAQLKLGQIHDSQLILDRLAKEYRKRLNKKLRERIFEFEQARLAESLPDFLEFWQSPNGIRSLQKAAPSFGA